MFKTISLFAALFAGFVVFGSMPAFAGAHCDRHPGDFLGTDGRCHASGAHAAKASRAKTKIIEPTVGAVQHTPPAQAIQQENASKFGEFSSRCDEQAAKRAAILGVPVVPQKTGDANSISHCHIDAQFTESGAL